MKGVSRQEFNELVSQVRSLERQVDQQQKQIATLKRRTTTDAGVVSGSRVSGAAETVPVSRIQLDIIDILKDNSAEETPISVDDVKNEAAKLNHLRSSAKSVIRKWIKQGYLIGDLDGEVEVSEWPPETETTNQ